jgi:hypothetical protein
MKLKNETTNINKNMRNIDINKFILWMISWKRLLAVCFSKIKDYFWYVVNLLKSQLIK